MNSNIFSCADCQNQTSQNIRSVICILKQMFDFVNHFSLHILFYTIISPINLPLTLIKHLFCENLATCPRKKEIISSHEYYFSNVPYLPSNNKTATGLNYDMVIYYLERHTIDKPRTSSGRWRKVRHACLSGFTVGQTHIVKPCTCPLPVPVSGERLTDCFFALFWMADVS